MTKMQPSVSIIIPCRNEEQFIDNCLESVFAFDPVEGGVEVIVVDGMSQDGTRDILAQWQARYFNLKVLDNPRGIAPCAMNIGIKAAKGNWIIVLNAHSEYPEDYVRLCLETSQRTEAENVGGVVKTLSRNNSIGGLLVLALTTHRFGVGNSNFRLNVSEGYADTAAFGCYRREIFDRIGFYDERLVRNQDYELNKRLLRSGGRIWLNPKIRAYYYNQGSIWGLLRQAIYTAPWNTWMWYVAPYAFAPRHLIPGIFVFILAGLIFLSCLSASGLILLSSLLLIYGTFSLIASIKQGRRYGLWMIPLLPFLFLLYHVTYGIGIIWGSLRLLVGNAPVQKLFSKMVAS